VELVGMALIIRNALEIYYKLNNVYDGEEGWGKVERWIK
jgi:hypothetical protein